MTSTDTKVSTPLDEQLTRLAKELYTEENKQKRRADRVQWFLEQIPRWIQVRTDKKQIFTQEFPTCFDSEIELDAEDGKVIAQKLRDLGFPVTTSLELKLQMAI